MNDWLSRLEQDDDIDILFACEAGSRAWGIESPHSDYDIRFIYRYRGLRKYLTLNKAKSSLDFQSPFDAVGYDIFKAFELMAKSNPSLYEWAYSPILYKVENGFSDQLKKVIEMNYSPYALFKHYGSLSKRNVNECSRGSFTLKKQKQLLQALRAELIRIGLVTAKLVKSPFELIEIAKVTHPTMFSAYMDISEAKRKHELLTPYNMEQIIHLLQSSLQETEKLIEAPESKPSTDFLNQWIWDILGV